MGNGLGAIAKVPALGWGQIVAYCAACEISGMSNRSDAPGDFGWKVLTSSDPEEKNKKLAAEIANGRLAMMAIIGMFFQDGLTGSAWGDWALYTASPLRARGGARGGFDMTVEPGALPPLGFWDPCGFSKTDAEFKEYRGKELKHGRVANGNLRHDCAALLEAVRLQGCASRCPGGHRVSWFRWSGLPLPRYWLLRDEYPCGFRGQGEPRQLLRPT